MRLTFFSTLTFLSYLFEGFLIAAALDLTLNDGTLLLHLGGEAASGPAARAAEFISVIVFFILGHANSTLAHLFFQQFITRWEITRPSYYFLNLIGTDEASEFRFRGNLFKRSLLWIWKPVWKPFDSTDKLRIRNWMNQRNIDPSYGDQDRDVFAQGFWKLSQSEKKEKFDEIIMNFNFSRNMLCTFIIIGLLFWSFGDIQATAQQLNLVDCEFFSQTGCLVHKQYNAVMVASVYLTTLSLLFLRFFYFFGVITKNVIRFEVDFDEASDAKARADARVPHRSTALPDPFALGMINRRKR
ncbi:MAG: hypothetical protein AAGD13_24035 [Pseudomonadota bacterium]